MSWLDRFMEATREAESPRSYFYWSGLSVISAVIRNNIWLNKHLYKLYPNMYVLLIGKSGLRKSAPVAIAKNLVEALEVTKVIYGRASIQAIVKALGEVQNLSDGRILKDANAFIVSTEFSASLVKDDAAMTLLTDLQDGHYHEGGWKNTLKQGGTDKLERPCVTLLSASNPAHFDDVVSAVSMMGGFIARTILVVEDKKSRINDLLDPPEIPFDMKEFLPYLREVSQVKGEIKLDAGAKKVYRDWYKEFAMQDIEDKTGTAERLNDRILKVAINLSMSDNLDLIITEEQMIKSMELCLSGVSLANKATMHQGKSELAPKTAIIVQRLMQSPDCRLTRTQILRKEWGNVDSSDLNRIIETLTEANAVEVIKEGKAVFYQLVPAFVDAYNRA